MQAAANLLTDHLIRLLACACLSILIALLLLSFRKGDFWRGFGIMTLGWSAVNLVIGNVSLVSAPPQSLAPLREFLAFNLGLNVAYIGVGLTIALLSQKEFTRGMGWAVVPQGFLLLVLDGYLLWRLPQEIAR